MATHTERSPHSSDRREFLRTTAVGLSGLALAASASAQPAVKDKPPDRGKPTKFQIACMTYVYSPYPLERALTGSPCRKASRSSARWAALA